jgi:hypothetical protein
MNKKKKSKYSRDYDTKKMEFHTGGEIPNGS